MATNKTMTLGDGSSTTVTLNVNGNITVPTTALTDDSTNVATTHYVQNAISSKANLASPSFTGTPTAPTVTDTTDSSTKIATTAFVHQYVEDNSQNINDPLYTYTATFPSGTADSYYMPMFRIPYSDYSALTGVLEMKITSYTVEANPRIIRFFLPASGIAQSADVSKYYYYFSETVGSVESGVSLYYIGFANVSSKYIYVYLRNYGATTANLVCQIDIYKIWDNTNTPVELTHTAAANGTGTVKNVSIRDTHYLSNTNISGSAAAAGYLSSFYPAYISNYHYAGEALTAATIVGQAADGKIYKLSNTTTAFDKNVKMFSLTTAVSSGAAINYTYARNGISVPIAYATASFGTVDTITRYHKYYAQFSLSSGAFYSDNILRDEKNRIAGKYYLYIGHCSRSASYMEITANAEQNLIRYYNNDDTPFVYNIKDYKTSSGTWDTAWNTIYNMCDAGATIWFPEGTYTFATGKTITKKLCVTGSKGALITFTTGGFVLSSTVDSSNTTTSTASESEISNITLISGTTTETGIKIIGGLNSANTVYGAVNHCLIDNVTFYDEWVQRISSSDMTYYWFNCIWLVDTWGTTVRNCHINSHSKGSWLKRHGSGIRINQCANIILSNNYVESKWGGIYTPNDIIIPTAAGAPQHCDGVQIEGGNMVACDYGCRLDAGTNFYIHNVCLDQIGQYGYVIGDTSASSVTTRGVWIADSRIAMQATGVASTHPMTSSSYRVILAKNARELHFTADQLVGYISSTQSNEPSNDKSLGFMVEFDGCNDIYFNGCEFGTQKNGGFMKFVNAVTAGTDTGKRANVANCSFHSGTTDGSVSYQYTVVALSYYDSTITPTFVNCVGDNC